MSRPAAVMDVTLEKVPHMHPGVNLRLLKGGLHCGYITGYVFSKEKVAEKLRTYKKTICY